ncbi:MAG: hypothetical protein VST70_00765 [Nitrospirota bacterium]|nr:hypothetical protein [Nitrospirota bacterium]
MDLAVPVRGTSNHYDTFSLLPLVGAGGRPTMTNRMLRVRQTHLFVVDPREIDADAVLTATVRRVKKGGSSLSGGGRRRGCSPVGAGQLDTCFSVREDIP